MLSALMMLVNVVRLPCRLAWRAYGIIWWAFGDGTSMRDAWNTPSGRMRACYRSAVGIIAIGAVGASLLARDDVLSTPRAWMAFGWVGLLAFVGSAFFGGRSARRVEPPAPARSANARSVESTLEGASRLIRHDNAAAARGRRAAGPPVGVRQGLSTVGRGGRQMATVMAVAARSSWAGVKHAAATYRALRTTPSPRTRDASGE
jgi:hypothetical protein